MNKPKPKIFIASSSAALMVARNVKSHLKDIADVTVWDDLPPTLTLGKTIIQVIEDILDNYDFAIMIFAADDIIIDPKSTGNQTQHITRDNVIFELGLFMAHLGRYRTFIVRETGVKLKTLSDLDGVLVVEYDGRTDNMRDALNDACIMLHGAIVGRGLRERDPDNGDLVKQIATLRDIQSLTGVVGIQEQGIQINVLHRLLREGKHVRILQTWTPDVARFLEDDLLHCVEENGGSIEALLIKPGYIATHRRMEQERVSLVSSLPNLPDEDRQDRYASFRNESLNEIKDTLKVLQRVRNKCTEVNQSRVQFRIYNHLPSVPFYMVDHNLFMGFFPKEKRASKGPFLHIQGPDNVMWRALQDEFDRLWQLGHSAEDLRL